MEQDLTPRGGPALGMYACDQELFERVWQRVMPEDRPDCPIIADTPVHTPAPAPGECTAAVPAPACGMDATAHSPAAAPPPQAEEPPMAPADTPVPEPSAPAPTAPDGSERTLERLESQGPAGDDFPRPDAVPCLGSASASHGSQLQEDVLAALEGWQLYRHLARKVTGSASRTLSALASEKHKQARKLAAAHFLISGVRYWPTDKLDTPRFGSWLGTLRRRFAAEQQLDSRWRAASLDTEDPCLAVLYGELAEDCAAHAGVLRSLLEQAL